MHGVHPGGTERTARDQCHVISVTAVQAATSVGVLLTETPSTKRHYVETNVLNKPSFL
jgi:hypothetical protein